MFGHALSGLIGTTGGLPRLTPTHTGRHGADLRRFDHLVLDPMVALEPTDHLSGRLGVTFVGLRRPDEIESHLTTCEHAGARRLLRRR